MVVAPTLLGPDLEASPQVGKVFACKKLYWQEFGLRTAFAQIWRPGPKPPECWKHSKTNNHLEDLWTPNGLGPDLAAKTVFEMLEAEF